MKAYVLSQLRQRPRRSAGVILGLALGTALFVSLNALSTGFRRAAEAPLDEVGADVVVTRPAGVEQTAAGAQRGRGVRMPFGLAPLSGADVEAIAGMEEVGRSARALQLWDFGPRQTTTLLGVDPAAPAVGPGQGLEAKMVEGRNFRAGEEEVAVVDLHYARFYDLRPGSAVVVGAMRFQVVGVVELTQASQAAAANVYVPLARAQALAGLGPDQVNQVYVEVPSAGEVDDLVRRLTQRLGRVSVITEDSIVQVMGGVARVSSRFATVAGVVALAGGLLIGGFAIQGSVAERRAEIGLMRAVGWRRRDVSRLFVLESLGLSVVGGFMGLILGLGVAGLLGRLPTPSSTPSLSEPGQFGPGPGGRTGDRALPVQVGLPVTVAALLLVPIGGTLAGASTARRAAAHKPVLSLRSP
jgi:ABC-type antimicrobial peptide transport system permease subunit